MIESNFLVDQSYPVNQSSVCLGFQFGNDGYYREPDASSKFVVANDFL